MTDSEAEIRAALAHHAALATTTSSWDSLVQHLHRPDVPPAPQRTRRPRHRLRIAAAAGIVLALVAAAVIGVRSLPDTGDTPGAAAMCATPTDERSALVFPGLGEAGVTASVVDDDGGPDRLCVFTSGTTSVRMLTSGNAIAAAFQIDEPTTIDLGGSTPLVIIAVDPTVATVLVDGDGPQITLRSNDFVAVGALRVRALGLRQAT